MSDCVGAVLRLHRTLDECGALNAFLKPVEWNADFLLAAVQFFK